MKPVVSKIEVPESPDQVFDLIEVLARHESFTDHFLVDWSVSGPRAGVGAKARMRLDKPGPPDWLEMEVTASDRPQRSVERAISAAGERVTRGTYRLEPTANGGTRIAFELAWERAPLIERLLSPLPRALTRRANARALHRLALELSREALTA